MSRAAKPKPNGEPPDHRIQIHRNHVEWLKARRAMKANGLPTLSALCSHLLSREQDRLGITDELVLAEERAAAKPTKKKRS
jgi:hypothetical protein